MVSRIIDLDMLRAVAGGGLCVGEGVEVALVDANGTSDRRIGSKHLDNQESSKLAIAK